MAYELTLHRRAAKAIQGLPTAEQATAIAKLRRLADDPRTMPDVEKLTGQDAYRLRVGARRVVYTVDHDLKAIAVSNVAHRSEVYRLSVCGGFPDSNQRCNASVCERHARLGVLRGGGCPRVIMAKST
jgi:mRNA-degrading endonuclease RelE of RelBE toxin-antitoxin system